MRYSVLRLRPGYAAAVLTLVVAACTGAMQRLYPGPPRPASEIALLKHQTGFANPSVFFTRIDDTRFPSVAKKFFDVELTPGSHEVEFGYEAAQSRSIDPALLVFEAEPGKQYEARALIQQDVVEYMIGRGRWGGVIVDLSSNRVVSFDKGAAMATPTPTWIPEPQPTRRLGSSFGDSQ